MVDLILFLTFTVLTGIGISVGYHRLFTHRAFRTSEPVKFVLGVLGSMAGQGNLRWWVVNHAWHHRHADKPGDPHSPRHGFWHAHVGWLWDGTAYDPDPRFRLKGVAGFVDKTYWYWFALGLAIPFAVGGWSGLLWGGIVRLVWVYNVTWAINSICHLVGVKDHATPDDSRNVVILAPLTMGESLHNNHHHEPGHARFGPWYLDCGYAVICLLEKLGIVWGVRR